MRPVELSTEVPPEDVLGTDAARSAFITHLDELRREVSQAMWQAPTLTVAAQAFLLRILTDDSVSGFARLVIGAAGVAATFAALWSLLRLREREVLYHDAIAHQFDAWNMPDPRPEKLERKPLKPERPGSSAKLDRRLQEAVAPSESRRFPIHVVWGVVLLGFVLADIVALACTSVRSGSTGRNPKRAEHG